MKLQLIFSRGSTGRVGYGLAKDFRPNIMELQQKKSKDLEEGTCKMDSDPSG